MQEPETEETPAPTRERRLWSIFLSDAAPLDLRILGRMLAHSALVGLAGGIFGALFFGGLEVLEHFVLHNLTGYKQLSAGGMPPLFAETHDFFRPWMLVIVPALGGLGCGLIASKFAPETQGGGGDAMLDAFHHNGGVIRKRVPWVKLIVSYLTLGTGGSGGREGPTMQIGGAVGSLVGQVLRVSTRERRILLTAGVAAGMSAVFRTPLGAALLATEVLYRDDFESDALIPALLASVVSYSVFISLFGEATLFTHAPHYPFTPAHLPLYALLAVCLAGLALVFVKVLRAVQALSRNLSVPLWLKPAIGGLALGAMVAPLLYIVGERLGTLGNGLGILGGGYGLAQLAISGADFLPSGWLGVELLLLLCAAKLIATSLTIGTGGSAGDFAPSLVLGGVFGGAFGRAAQLLLDDPRIDPGAFALVGMGTLYGGIAHVPISALVMVSELAGSYELLVPLMLTEAIAFILLRKRTLYHAQLPSKVESPAHAALPTDVLKARLVREVMTHDRPYASFHPATHVSELLHKIADSTWQDVFPVLDSDGKIIGIVTTDQVKILAAERDLEIIAVTADVMQPVTSVRESDDLSTATRTMLAGSMRAVPVINAEGTIVGFLDEADIRRAYVAATEEHQERAGTLRAEAPSPE